MYCGERGDFFYLRLALGSHWNLDKQKDLGKFICELSECSLFRCNWSFAGALAGGRGGAIIDVLRSAIGTGVYRIFIGGGHILRNGSHMQTLHCL